MTSDQRLSRSAAVPESQLDRIERKLDTLIKALAEEGDEEPDLRTLDGDPAGQERDQSQAL